VVGMHVDLAEFGGGPRRHRGRDILVVGFPFDQHGVTDKVSVGYRDEERMCVVGEVARERVRTQVPRDVRRLRLSGRVRRAREGKGERSKTGEQRGIRVARPSDAERLVQAQSTLTSSGTPGPNVVDTEPFWM
jgi:hypothetical protein